MKILAVNTMAINVYLLNYHYFHETTPRDVTPNTPQIVHQIYQTMYDDMEDLFLGTMTAILIYPLISQTTAAAFSNRYKVLRRL